MTNPTLPVWARSATIFVSLIAFFVLTNSPADAMVLPSQQRCQKSISKAARAYVAGVLKRGAQCRLAELAAGGRGACDDAKTLARLAKEAAKFDSKVRKGCANVSAEDLSTARPFGLGFAANLDELIATQKARFAELAEATLDDLYAPSASASTPPGRAGLKCQKSLDKAAAAQLKNVFRGVGSKCHDREDRGKDVTVSRYRLTTACLELAKDDLARRALHLVEKSVKSCGESFPAQLAVCGTTAGSLQTTEEAVACVLERATAVGVAVIESEHAHARVELVGNLHLRLSPADTMTVPGARIQLRDSAGVVVSSATTNASGGFRLEGIRFRDYRICWVRNTVASCSDTAIEIGRYEPGSSIELPAPLDSGESVQHGRLLRQDGSPCFDMAHAPEITTRGQVRWADPTGEPLGIATPVSSSGEFLLIGDDTTTRVVAECGLDSRLVDIDNGANGEITVIFDNAGPVGRTITIADLEGLPIADINALSGGDEVILTATFEDEDPLTYYWQVTRGGGTLTPLDDGRAGAASRAAPGNQRKWKLASNTEVQQIRVTASDGRAGTTSLVAQGGPFQLPSEIGPLPWNPCDFFAQIQIDLCGQGYTSDDNNDGVNDVPEPAGGRTNFLTAKFGGNPVKNDTSACLYYNIIDPDCVDLDCDGVVDPGTDPGGICKRMTLGGWWEKNGFDPVDGLGTGEVDAWYLNSNDLGFGREMHCRVTSYSYPLLAALRKEARSAPRGSTGDPRRTHAAELDSYALYLALASPWADPAALKVLAFRWPSTIACYVANYTTDHCNNYPTNNPTNADLAYQGQIAIEADPTQNPLHAYGTVAMEFSPIEGFGELGSLTKFYVYGGRTAESERLYDANLDGCGEKSVPELCMACHGGSWPGSGTQTGGADLAGIYPFDGGSASEVAAFQARADLIEPMTPNSFGFSSFLPFDPDTYLFPAAADEAAQHDSLRALNRLVRYTEPKDAIIELTKGFYGNNFSTGTFANFMPSSSSMDPALYTNVYATACRGCHAATYQVTPTPGRICVDDVSGEGGGYDPTMPHAKLTYLNFWRSDFPQSAAQVHMDSLVSGGTCREP
ncbi:MAG: carboxypeptidase-like regulatory domain-containing protein [Deltaproteobacteria bacterium]